MSLKDEGEEETLQIPKLEMYIFSAGMIITGAVVAAGILLMSNTAC